MSGWIKVEKELPDKISFRRLLKQFRAIADNALLTHSDALLTALLLGSLIRLWVYADSHIEDDDTLAVTRDEIDEFIGLNGFSAAMPPEWLQVIDPQHVKLPNFLAHNGTSARQRKLNAERQARFRHRNKTGQIDTHVTHSNARNDARPDQIRPDQKKNKKVAPDVEFATASVENLDQDAWRDWLRYRSERKPAIRPASLRKAAEAMARLKDQRAAVDYSIANGYQGLFEPKSINSPKPNGHDSPARQAWRALISSRGKTRGPREQAAITAIGGWSAIEGRTDFTSARIEAAFCQAWERV